MTQEQIRARLAELEAANAAAPGWGAAVGARFEEIRELQSELAALERKSARDLLMGEAIAFVRRASERLGDSHDEATVRRIAERVVRALPTPPTRGAGGDDA